MTLLHTLLLIYNILFSFNVKIYIFTAIVYLVRGDLTKLQRKCLGALTTMDVHARDTTETMVTAGIESDTQFEWMRELRYYWINVDGKKKKGKKKSKKKRKSKKKKKFFRKM